MSDSASDNKSDEFGFDSSQVANREVDPFANLSEAEFQVLLDLSTQVMELQGIQERSEAMKVAKAIHLVYDAVMTSTASLGIRKYGSIHEYRRLVLRELASGKQPCPHGYITPITDCGVCLAQARIDKHTQNPVKPPRRCLHTRVDLKPFGEDQPPCAACQQEEEEELALELQKRAEYEAKLEKLATMPPARPVDLLGKLLKTTPPSLQERQEGTIAEMNALIGVLLDKLDGEAALSSEDMEKFEKLKRLGEMCYSVEPSFSSVELLVKRIGPEGNSPFKQGGYIRPNTVLRTNPNAQPAPPSWMSRHDPGDDEDLPF